MTQSGHDKQPGDAYDAVMAARRTGHSRVVCEDARGLSVNTELVALRPILSQAFLALLLGPPSQRIPFANKFE